MGTLFDIDFVTTKFGVTNVGHYLGLLKKASIRDLRRFRAEVKQHKKTHPQQQAFSNVPDYSTHEAILAAISHELRKRAFYYSIYLAILPVKRVLASMFRGLELKNHKDFRCSLHGAKEKKKRPTHVAWRVWYAIGSVLHRPLEIYYCLAYCPRRSHGKMASIAPRPLTSASSPTAYPSAAL